ncbi:MAG: right-handed parallel beta-helix repeat-containing protein, partial [Planctomycetota bacterium]
SAVSSDLPIIIKNGYIRNFIGDGLATATSAASLVVHNVHVDDCLDGIDSIGTANLIDCSARNCAGDGIRINSSGRSAVVRCIAENNALDGIQIDNGSARDCSAFLNGAAGFLSGSDTTLSGCVSQNNITGFSTSAGATLDNCVASINTGSGFACSTSTTLINCAARSNGSIGFITSNGSAFENCSARLNTLEGFVTGAGSVVTNCVAASNQEDGFQLNSDTRIFNCAADGNGTAGANFAGIRGSSDTTIDSCTVTDNPTGIIGGNGGFVTRCAAAGNTTPYDMTGTDHGLIITPAGGFTSSNAWANISY